MALRDTIANVAGRALVHAGMSTWSYRRRTSGPAASPATYDAAWTAIAKANPSAFQIGMEPNEKTGAMVRVERGTLRVPEAVVLYPGDEVRNGTIAYEVVGQEGLASLGTIRYQLKRAVPTYAGENRGGGP